MKFTVIGVPAPQGSKSAFVRGGRAVVVEGGSTKGRQAHRAWRDAVSWSAHELAGESIEQPVSIRIDFVMPRPKSAPKKATWAPKKPDLDKLVRSTLDGITDAGVWRDDSQVVSLIATKRLAADEPTGAHIEISVLS